MAAFDAETYLRALSADTVGAERDFPPAPSPLLAATQALVAVAAIDEEAAQRVLDEHELERHRRDPDASWRWERVWPTAPLPARRVSLAGGPVAHAEGELRVRYVVLAEDGARLAVSLRRRRWRPKRFPFRPHVVVSDAHGNSAHVGFSGGGKRGEWHGNLRSRERLDAATRAVTIDGCRVDLIGEPADVQIEIEALPTTDDALAHLRHRAALADPCFDCVVRALVAAGAVASDESELTSLRPADNPFVDVRRVERTVAIGVVTPLFAGVTVAVDALETTSTGWSVSVEVAPEGAMRFPWEAPTARLISLAWQAVDDRGRRYLGRAGGGGTAEGAYGAVAFAEPLDPDARWIELQPATETARARIRVDLQGTSRRVG